MTDNERTGINTGLRWARERLKRLRDEALTNVTKTLNADRTIGGLEGVDLAIGALSTMRAPTAEEEDKAAEAAGTETT
jgi:hypothetical protein